MKTILQHLETLPEPYRTQAIENVDEAIKDLEEVDLKESLHGAFMWNNSNQGYRYWLDLFNSL
jgi:methionine synthase II (cobalamin-independent)